MTGQQDCGYVTLKLQMKWNKNDYDFALNSYRRLLFYIDWNVNERWFCKHVGTQNDRPNSKTAKIMQTQRKK